MKEAGVWASVLVALALLSFVWPIEAVVGTFTLLAFLTFVIVEFLNLLHWIERFRAKLGHEPAPDSVDRSVGLMYQDHEYANTRNAHQQQGGRHG